MAGIHLSVIILLQYDKGAARVDGRTYKMPYRLKSSKSSVTCTKTELKAVQRHQDVEDSWPVGVTHKSHK